MSSVAQVGAFGAALAVLVVLAGAVATIAVLVRRAGADRARRDTELSRSRAEIEALSRRVAELSDEVVQTRRVADAGYVITSLAEVSGAELIRADATPGRRGDAGVGRVVEEQLLGVLSGQRDRSPLRARAVDLVVSTVALGHGVRRAMTADVLDRAAAEAHVARRRSRRDRRREARAARRLVRSARAQRTSEDAA